YNILDKQRKCINEIVDKLNKNKEDYEIKIRTIRPLLGNRSNFLSMQKRCHENSPKNDDPRSSGKHFDSKSNAP
ncbi:MAG: hypothetical protein J7L07_08010, partial [Candidatus Odinarchaeota archaeon]|nr:hypothetical protein [Candidatus Odinarchaeota archaeon]